MSVSSRDRRTGVERIADERSRQVASRGLKHDLVYNRMGELAWAAVCYASPGGVYRKFDYSSEVRFKDPWPWDMPHDKRSRVGNVVDRRKQSTADRIRELEKAGALVAAEIDRLLAIGGAS